MKIKHWIIPILLTLFGLVTVSYAVTGDLTYWFYDNANKILRPVNTISSSTLQIPSLATSTANSFVKADSTGKLILGSGGSSFDTSTLLNYLYKPGGIGPQTVTDSVYINGIADRPQFTVAPNSFMAGGQYSPTAMFMGYYGQPFVTLLSQPELMLIGDAPSITGANNPLLLVAKKFDSNLNVFGGVNESTSTFANVNIGLTNNLSVASLTDPTSPPTNATILGRTGGNFSDPNFALIGGNSSYLLSTGGDLYLGSTDTSTGKGNIRFFSGNRNTTSSERMVITNDGKLGINTTNPTYQISVDGSGSNPAVLYLRAAGVGNFVLGDRSSGTITNPTATGANSLIIVTGGGYDGTKWVSQKGEMRIISDGTWTTTSTPTYFEFNNTPVGSTVLQERMRITSAGYVGIGSSTPSTLLVVNGTSTLKNTLVNGNITTTGTSTASCFTTDGTTCITGGSGGGDAYLSHNQTFTGTNIFATTTLAYNSTIGNSTTYFSVINKSYGAYGSLPMVKFNSTGFAFGNIYGAMGDALIIGEQTIAPQLFLVNSDISKTAGFSLTTSTGDLNINSDGKIILGSNTSIGSTLTLNTSFNGLLKATAGAVSVATPGSDYVTSEVDPIWTSVASSYFKLTGLPGGQIAYGGTGSLDNLTLGSTSNATKGLIKFGSSAYNETTNYLGIGIQAPTNRLDVAYGNMAFIQVPAPDSLTATLVATPGNVNVGTYSYRFTYINASGETYLSTISNVVTVATTTEAQIALTNITTSTVVGVTQRKIYRTKAGGTDYYLLTTLANNTATTFTDNVADASLGADSAIGRDNTTAGYIYTNGQKGGYIGSNNDALGWLALANISYGSNNVAMGAQALRYLTTGVQNFGLGNSALGALIDGASNVAVGHNALANSVHDSGNVAVGRQGLISVNGGTSNTCAGYNCLLTVSTGSYNIGIGFDAGYNPLGISANAIKTGNANIAIGYRAGQSNTGVWSNSVAIGKDAMFGASNVFALGGVGADAVKVGMGTSVPSSTLHVISNIANGATAVVSIFDTASIWATTGAKLASWRNNGTENAFIDYAGDSYLAGSMGIGTSTFTENLNIVSNEDASGGGGTLIQMQNLNATGLAGFKLLDNTGDGSYFINSSFAGNGVTKGFNGIMTTNTLGIGFGYAGAGGVVFPWLTINSDLTGKGYVGINTTTPNATFQVNGSFSTAYITTSTNFSLDATMTNVEIVSSSVVATLPSAVGLKGVEYTLINVSTGNITASSTSIIGNSGTDTTMTIGSGNSLTFISNNTVWRLK